MSSSSNLQAGFAVLRLVTDMKRGTSVPVGAVAWDSEREWYRVRVLGDGEKLESFSPDRRLLVKLAGSSLEAWAKQGEVPYSRMRLQPWTSEFWDSARQALTTGLKLDTPRAMDPVNSPDEVDALYEALVQPIESGPKVRDRIDGILTRALGTALSKRIKRKIEVSAFHSAREHVLRGAYGQSGVLIVEAVNLAGRGARHDADALVSKLLRIQEAHGALGDVQTIVAFRSSPQGLNGESHMRDWISLKVTDMVFDINRDSEELRIAAASALDRIGAIGQVNLDSFSNRR